MGSLTTRCGEIAPHSPLKFAFYKAMLYHTLYPRNNGLLTAQLFYYVKVEYSGTKDYNKSFTDAGSNQANMSFYHVVEGLVPGSQYTFTVFGTSVCGKGNGITLERVITNVEGTQCH